jgi:uncharacterized RDD family membrane protein YckC
MERNDLEYAGFWRRFAACIIDAVLTILVTYPVLYFVYGAAYFNRTSLSPAGTADVLVSWVLPAVLVIWFWVSANGQTPGKRVVGCRVVDAETGDPVSVGKGIVRYLAYFVSMIGLFIGYLWVGFDPKKQGWHDHIAGTVVVRNRATVSFEHAR